MKGKFLKLVNNERKLAQILPNKACAGFNEDYCPRIDDAKYDCDGWGTSDICMLKDYTSCHGFMQTDYCETVDR